MQNVSVPSQIFRACRFQTSKQLNLYANACLFWCSISRDLLNTIMGDETFEAIKYFLGLNVRRSVDYNVVQDGFRLESVYQYLLSTLSSINYYID